MKNEITEIAILFVDAFIANDIDKVESLLAEDIVSFITNRRGKADKVIGKNDFTKHLLVMDIKNVQPKIRITQLLKINDFQVMFMIEVIAKKGLKELHNFAAYLIGVNNNYKINSYHMVEALPEYSDDFWKKP